MIKRLATWAALLLIAGAVGLLSAFVTFDHAQRHVVIGAHSTTVKPTFDGHATIDFGPVLPRIRLPIDQPLGIGVDIDVGDTEVASIEAIIARDAVIASQPEGEIAKVSQTVMAMAKAAALRGVGAALLTGLFLILAWRAIGPRRRATLVARRPRDREVLLMGGAAIATVAGLVLVAVPEVADDEQTDTSWVSLTSVFAGIPSDPVLDKIEIAQGGATQTSHAIVESAIDTYQTSVRFYGKLEQRAANVTVRQPEEGQKTALVVTDRHDNIAMDPVAREIADAAKAEILIDLGDDTSSGGQWEEFSINSLADAFEGFDVVAVAGNHDTGKYIIDAMKDNGFNVMAGEPQEVAGIRFLGESDPRSSAFTAGYSGPASDAQAAVDAQDARLTEIACEDGNVSTLVMHSPASTQQAAASGCVDLVLTGHLHRQVGPNVVISPEGDRTVTLTTGSTGGAVYAFALGSKLRRPAQVTIVTFEEGIPVGVQLVDFEPGGSIGVQPYVDFDSLKLAEQTPTEPTPTEPTPTEPPPN